MAKTEHSVVLETTATGNGAELTTEKLAALEKTAVAAESISEELNKEIDKLGDESSDAAKALKKEAEALNMVAKNAKKAVSENKQMAATTNKVEGAQRKANKQTRNSGLAFLEVSRAVEDAQYGLRGVLNNLPQIALHFGLGAGLAGAVSLAAVALATLMPLLGGTEDSMKKLGGSVGEMTDAFKNLGDFSKLDDQFDDFTDSIDRQNTAIDESKKKYEAYISTRQELRQLTIEDMKMTAELEKQAIDAEVDAGSLSEADAIRKKGAIDMRLAIANGADKVERAKEELAIIERQEIAVKAMLASEKERFEHAKQYRGEEEIERLEAQLRSQKSQAAASNKEFKEIDLTKGSLGAGLSSTPVVGEMLPRMAKVSQSDQAILEDMKQISKDMENAGDDPVTRKEILEEIIRVGKMARENQQARDAVSPGARTSGIEQNAIDAGNAALAKLTAERNVSGLTAEIEKAKEASKAADKTIEEFNELKRKAKVELDQISAQKVAKQAKVGLISNTENTRQTLLGQSTRSATLKAADAAQAAEDKAAAKKEELLMRQQAKEQQQDQRAEAQAGKQQSRIDNKAAGVGMKAIGIAGGVGNQAEVVALQAKMQQGYDGYSAEEVLGLRDLVSSMTSFVDKNLGDKAKFTAELTALANEMKTLQRKLDTKEGMR